MPQWWFCFVPPQYWPLREFLEVGPARASSRLRGTLSKDDLDDRPGLNSREIAEFRISLRDLQSSLVNIRKIARVVGRQNGVRLKLSQIPRYKGDYTASASSTLSRRGSQCVESLLSNCTASCVGLAVPNENVVCPRTKRIFGMRVCPCSKAY